MAADPKELREFEVWARIKFHSTVLGRLNGRYANPTVEHAWQGWLARSAVPIPEGYVLVPVEPTEEMQDAGRDANDSYATEIAPCSAMRANAAWKAMIAASQPTSDAMISATTDRGEG